jgi:hypothetical protein
MFERAQQKCTKLYRSQLLFCLQFPLGLPATITFQKPSDPTSGQEPAQRQSTNGWLATSKMGSPPLMRGLEGPRGGRAEVMTVHYAHTLSSQVMRRPVAALEREQ